MQLTKNFNLREFERSYTAERHGIVNKIPAWTIPAWKGLAVEVLQPARDRFKRVVDVGSGYRCDELNALVGGSKSSQHRARHKDCAADIEIVGVPNIELAAFIRDECRFDQLILEYPDPDDGSAGWVHVSFSLVVARLDVRTKLRSRKKTVRGLTETYAGRGL